MKQRRKQCNKEGAGEATEQGRKHNETKKDCIVVPSFIVFPSLFRSCYIYAVQPKGLPV